MSLVTGKSALSAVSEAVLDVLNVEAFSGETGICSGGVWDVVPPDNPFPYTWFSVDEVPNNSFSQFGQSVELHLHIFTQGGSMRTAQLILDMAVTLLNAATQTVPGFTFQWLDALGTVQQATFLVDAVRTHHLESRFTVMVGEAE